MRKILSIFLFPLSIWYAVAILFRNLFFKAGIFKRKKHEIPTICVGNLTTGGTGKTPHVEYLISLLSKDKNVAVLSRGYGRKTTGFILADDSATAQTIGDEPLQYYKKFKNITVAVCEKRNEGVEKLGKIANPPEIIILDDAFQHKSIIPSFNILLTEYEKPFYKDWILPFGNLREFRSAYKTADVIIVTKCPQTLTEQDRQDIIEKIRPQDRQKIFFSGIEYGEPIVLNGFSFSDFENILVVSGIANPKPLYDFLEKDYHIEKIAFPDHHAYSKSDILHIKKRFESITSSSKAIITTEKDAMRFKDIPEFELLSSIPIFHIPIKVYFSDPENTFNQTIRNLSCLT